MFHNKKKQCIQESASNQINIQNQILSQSLLSQRKEQEGKTEVIIRFKKKLLRIKQQLDKMAPYKMIFK